MFPQLSHAKSSIPLVFLLLLSLTPIHAASAHTVKISADVGGTLHIEPNDNPQAGKPAQAWFALTRKGGKAIALKDCDCRLAIYAEPHTPQEPPLLEPPLKPVSAERYKDTPGAEITFPKPGAYQLALTGKPTSGESFKPFELKFQVTVASGSQTIPQASQNVNQSVNNEAIETQSPSLPLWAIAAAIFATLGIVLAVVQKRRR
ncbi:hypothetical protein H6G04_06015 [Calothrix membranacea FACHB-236]|nr:hypothetical protein [Calothrix membranacea FACHB-236]